MTEKNENIILTDEEKKQKMKEYQRNYQRTYVKNKYYNDPNYRQNKINNSKVKYSYERKTVECPKCHIRYNKEKYESCYICNKK